MVRSNHFVSALTSIESLSGSYRREVEEVGFEGKQMVSCKSYEPWTEESKDMEERRTNLTGEDRTHISKD